MTESKCKHERKVDVVKPKEVEVWCAGRGGCRQLIYVRERVNSSNVFAIGRDVKDTVVQFMNASKGPGAVYRVEDYPNQKHNELMNADSHGKYFAAHIRKSKYKVREEV